MENEKKPQPLDDRTNVSEELSEEDFALIRKLFPRPESNPDPIPYPFAPVRPAKWKQWR